MNPRSHLRGRGRIAALLVVVLVAVASIALYPHLRDLARQPDSVSPANSDAAAGPGTRAAAPSPPIGWVDRPAAESLVGPTVQISGWALSPVGIRGVEIRVGGRAYPATFGIARADVAGNKPGYPDSQGAGFAFTGDFSPLFGGAGAVRHSLEVVAVDRAGGETVLARKGLLLPTARSPWRALYVERRMPGTAPFLVLPGVSLVSHGGADLLDSTYRDYLSPTFGVGMRVPILYMRTTRGKGGDWVFDPDWDTSRRCGERLIAEDSLNATMAHARSRRLAVMFTLNGGVWGDAACEVPEWDATDHLEEDEANAQWNDRDGVMPDDYLKHLSGSQQSPQLGRMLTFNIYAQQNRRYKKRNLQAAGRAVAAFARAHPALFAGVNLDPDTYHSPFFEEKQWYDYNPGTLRQFREWLAGSGPYAGRGGPGVPDLRRYRRAVPLTLADVNRISGRGFARWDDVDPPRRFPREGKPFWEDPWTHEWELFRRHLVDLHYDELSQWLVEVGIPSQSIFSSQGFMGPHPAARPFAVRLDSPPKNYDTGGMSVEGAIPSHGHLGAIVYGPGAANDIRMETPDSLFATFRRMDPGWGIVEFNTADLRHPNDLPDYDIAYRTLREAFNFGARFVSPMAWNGSNGDEAGKPGYVSFTAWRNTPLEEAMRDFAASHAYVPLGTRLWTFGTPRHASADGWTGAPDVTVTAGKGSLQAHAGGHEVALISPDNLVIHPGETDLLVLAVDPPESLAKVRVDARERGGGWIALAPDRDARRLRTLENGLLVPLRWPARLRGAEQIRLVLGPTRPSAPVTVRHVALYPPAAAPNRQAPKDQPAARLRSSTAPSSNHSLFRSSESPASVSSITAHAHPGSAPGASAAPRRR